MADRIGSSQVPSRNFFNFDLPACVSSIFKKDSLIFVISTVALSIFACAVCFIPRCFRRNRIQSCSPQLSQVPFGWRISDRGAGAPAGPRPALVRAGGPLLRLSSQRASLDTFVKNLETGLLGQSSDRSTAFSSISILGVIGLLLADSEGSDKDQIIRSLGMKDEMSTHDAIGRLLDQIRLDSPSGTITVTQAIASKDPLDAALVRCLTNSYRGEVLNPNAHQSLATAVNDYVSKATHGMIPNLISGSIVDKALINVVYLNLSFLEPFKDGERFTFTSSKGATLAFQSMMAKGEEFSIGYNMDADRELVGYKIFRKPYESSDGRSLELRVLLPDVGTDLNGCMEHIVSSSLSFNEAPEGAKLFMPETKVIGDYPDLAQLFSDLGLPMPRGVNVIHKAVVHTSKKGSKAAAASAIVFRGILQNLSNRYVVDRPYGFAIVADHKAIFTGIVDDIDSIIPVLTN